MKILLYFLLISSSLGFAQATFEKGYFIDSRNQKMECHIKNEDWVKAPSILLYKQNESDETKEITTQQIKEFAVGTKIKFIKRKITIDNVKNKTIEFYDFKDYTSRIETTFLKVLVEGEANLYKYENETQFKYFYAKNPDSIKPLIYYQYKDGERLRTNDSFKKELFDNLNCESLTIHDFLKLKYQVKPLLNIFEQYNNCKNVAFIEYKANDTKGKLNLTPKIGYQFNFLKADFESDAFQYDYDYSKTKGSLTLGIEIEYLLPYNKNKYSIFIDPEYSSIKNSENYIDFKGYNNEFSIENSHNLSYSSIILPIGIRYNLYQKPNQRIYFSGAYAFNFVLKETYEFNQKREGPYNDYDRTFKFALNPKGNVMLGIGIRINKIGAEIKYIPGTELLNEKFPYQSNTIKKSTFGIALGYTL
jgi:hypothetical protein